MLIPYAIETLEQRRPTANHIIMGICVAVFLGDVLGLLPDSFLGSLVLKGFHPVGLIGHMFVHAGFLHLLGNMLFLWVFGNAICANTSNMVYPVLFLAFGACAALAHLLFNGGPAVGASGAINGITGMVLAVYPLNRVHLLWIAPAGVSRGRNLLAVRAWVIIMAWVVFDILWLMASEGTIGYWAHLGGFTAGVAVGLACLQAGWVQVADCDNRTLLDIIKGMRQVGHTRPLSHRQCLSTGLMKSPRGAGQSGRNRKGM